MDVMLADGKRYHVKVMMTQLEWENLQYIIKNFMEQIKAAANTHYTKEYIAIMKKIVNSY